MTDHSIIQNLTPQQTAAIHRMLKSGPPYRMSRKDIAPKFSRNLVGNLVFMRLIRWVDVENVEVRRRKSQPNTVRTTRVPIYEVEPWVVDAWPLVHPRLKF